MTDGPREATAPGIARGGRDVPRPSSYVSVPRPRLLFVALSPSSFVMDDVPVLERAFEVVPFVVDAAAAKGVRGMAGRLAAQAAWLRRELPRADAIYGWFADYHLLLPVLAARRAGVPVAVALGGFESNVLPAVGYGVMESRWRAPIARTVLRGADLLLPVAAALLAADNRFGAFPGVLRNGVRNRVPGLATPARVVPVGFDADAWPMGPEHREDEVAMVAFLDRARTAHVKGFDLFLAAARAMPDVRFRAVGVLPAFAAEIPGLYGAVPPNVVLDPPAPREALAAVYRRASVYALFSRTEGLPNVLCEAMLSGAIPVASRVGGAAEVVGEAGVVVETPEVSGLVAALRAALAMPTAMRHGARARIATHFTRAQRETALADALGVLVETGRAHRAGRRMGRSMERSMVERSVRRRRE